MTYRFCMQLLATPEPGSPQDGQRGRAVLVNAHQWLPGATITVRFLDGSETVRAEVQRYAESWLTRTGARLRFRWKESGDADIRISFNGEGSWSYVGTSCRQITDQSKPTMNYGWLTDASSEVEFREVVLHEFGHALGLVHEHQHPDVSIPWDKQAVYDELTAPPHNWNNEQIDFNIFRAYADRDMNGTNYDPKSIMHYPIPLEWTVGGFTVGNNTDLSPLDIELIQNIYR